MPVGWWLLSEGVWGRREEVRGVVQVGGPAGGGQVRGREVTSARWWVHMRMRRRRGIHVSRRRDTHGVTLRSGVGGIPVLVVRRGFFFQSLSLGGFGVFVILQELIWYPRHPGYLILH